MDMALLHHIPCRLRGQHAMESDVVVNQPVFSLRLKRLLELA